LWQNPKLLYIFFHPAKSPFCVPKGDVNAQVYSVFQAGFLHVLTSHLQNLGLAAIGSVYMSQLQNRELVGEIHGALGVPVGQMD